MIRFETGRTLGAGELICVLRDGIRIGRISYRDGVHRFHARQGVSLETPQLEDANLENLMDAIRKEFQPPAAASEEPGTDGRRGRVAASARASATAGRRTA